MIVTLNIPDANVTAIVGGICTATGWTSGSGQTQAQWAKAQVIAWIKETAKRGQLQEQRNTIWPSTDAVAIT